MHNQESDFVISFRVLRQLLYVYMSQLRKVKLTHHHHHSIYIGRCIIGSVICNFATKWMAYANGHRVVS